MKPFKRIAIVGGSKEGLSLLPLLEKDPTVRVDLIVDRNPEALVFKLNELGFQLARKFNIRVSSSLADLVAEEALDLIIDASSDPGTRSFLAKQDFRTAEIISALSAHLLWEYRGREVPETDRTRHTKLLASLNEIVEAVNLTKDKKQVSEMILKVALESTGADNGSLMLLDPEEQVLKIEVAEGIPPEVVPTIRCPLGEGIAGKVAREGKPLLLSGRADDRTFNILRTREDVKSALCVPLTINGQTVGVLNLNNLKDLEGFNEEDLAFITKLAAFDAEILLKSQEYEDLRGDARTFRIWKQLNQELSASQPLDEKLVQVCRTLSEHFSRSVCSIYLLDPDSHELSLRASNLKSFSPSFGHRIHLQEGIDGWAASEQEVVVLKEHPPVDSGTNKTFMSIPLITDGRITGVMNIQLVSSQGLSEEEEAFLRDVGGHLSHAISSAQKEDHAYLRATRLEAINEAGINIVSIMDMDKLLELIPPSASMIMDADGCILRLRERDGLLKVRSTYAMWEDEIQDKVLELDATLCAKVQQSKRALHIHDLGEAKGYEQFGRVVKSVLAFPLMENGVVHGVLSIYDKIPKGAFHVVSFSEDDLEIFRKFVHFVEKAIVNARGRGHSQVFLNYDKLTGLPNEAAFRREIQNEINRSKRHQRRFILLTLLWSYHRPGISKYDVELRNGILLDIADELKESIREYDTLARTGPQKFAMLFPESVENIRDLSTRLTRAIRRRKKASEPPLANLDLRLKFGYAIFPDDGTEFKAIVGGANRLRLGAKV
jgi:diguanylate cyclase (GGDEF)-like protein